MQDLGTHRLEKKDILSKDQLYVDIIHLHTLHVCKGKREGAVST